MKLKILFILFLSCYWQSLKAQEGIMRLIHNNPVRLVTPAGLSSNYSSLCIQQLANNTRVIVSSSISTATGVGVGLSDIDIVYVDGNNDIIQHLTYGIPGVRLTPKDVIEDQVNGANHIVIAGMDSSINGTVGFILRLDQTPNPTTNYHRYSINNYRGILFHQILRLRLPNSNFNGNPQYAVLASGKKGNSVNPIDFKDFVLLIDQNNLSLNSIQRIFIGTNAGSFGYHKNKTGYKLMTESDNARNSLYVAGSFVDLSSGNVIYGVNITRFDFVSGNLNYSANIRYFATNPPGGGWFHPNDIFYDPAIRNGRTGSIYISGGYQSGPTGSDLTTAYLSCSPDLNAKVDWFNELLPATPSLYLINGDLNSNMSVRNDELLITNNRGDMLSVNLAAQGAVTYFKSITQSLRSVSAYQPGDFCYDLANNVGYGVTAQVNGSNLQYFTMLLNNTDGCCFQVINQNPHSIGNDFDGAEEIPDAAFGSESSQLITLLIDNPDVVTEVQCSLCVGKTMDIAGPIDVWCQTSTYTFNGCRHATNANWTLMGPGGRNTAGKILTQNNNQVVIDWPRVIGTLGQLPGNYVLTLNEVIDLEDPSCTRELTHLDIVFRNLDCTTGVISGNNNVTCQGTNAYTFTGCPNFPTGATYAWTLTTVIGNAEASISGANNSPSVSINFNDATMHNVYELILTATYNGCTYTSAVYQITHDPFPFSGDITGNITIGCTNLNSNNYFLTNPDNATLSNINWSISPAGPRLTGVNTNSLDIDYTFAKSGTYILDCEITVGSCTIHRSVAISKQNCCPVINSVTNGYQSSYNSLIYNQLGGDVIGTTQGMYTSGSNSTLVLQNITNSVNSSFTISELDQKGEALNNRIYSVSISQDQFKATAFTESLINGRKIIIGNKDNRLFVAEIDENGAPVAGRQLTIAISGTNSTQILEAVSVVRSYDNGAGIGYCVLVNINENTYLVGIEGINWLSFWVTQVGVNASNSSKLHGHKLIEYTNNGISNFIILGVATGGTTKRGFIMDTKVTPAGTVSNSPVVKYSNNVYFTGREMPNVGLVFGGNDNPYGFSVNSAAVFLITDYQLATITEKAMANHQFEVLDVRVFANNHPMFLLLNGTGNSTTAPYLYHLLELDDNLNMIPNKGLYTIIRYNNINNDHNPYQRAVNLLDITHEGGFTMVGQDENLSDFIVYKTGNYIDGDCYLVNEMTLKQSTSDVPVSAYSTITGGNKGSFSLGYEELDLLRTCCLERDGVSNFDLCDMFNAKHLNIEFTPNTNEYCMDELIHLTATGEYDPDDVDYYEWVFSDGTVITSYTSNQIDHAFPYTNLTEASYSVYLVIHFKNKCIKTYSQIINTKYCDPCIKLNVIPDFKYRRCNNTLVLLPTQHFDGATYEWEFGDLTPNSLNEFESHEFPTTGNQEFEVCLTIRYQKCTARVCKKINFDYKDTTIYHCLLDGNECLWLRPGDIFPSDYCIVHLVNGGTPDYNSSLDPGYPSNLTYLQFCPGSTYEINFYSNTGCLLKKLRIHVEDKNSTAETYCSMKIPICDEMPNPEEVRPDCPDCYPNNIDVSKIKLGLITESVNSTGGSIFHRDINNLQDCKVCHFDFEFIHLNPCDYTPDFTFIFQMDRVILQNSTIAGVGFSLCGPVTWTVKDLSTGTFIPMTSEEFAEFPRQVGISYEVCMTITYCVCNNEPCTKTICKIIDAEQQAPPMGGENQQDNTVNGAGYQANASVKDSMTSVNSLKLKSIDLKIHPNPSSNKFTIVNQNAILVYDCVIITTSSGQEILKYNNNSATYEYNLEAYARGVYFVKVKVGDEIKVFKLILQ